MNATQTGAMPRMGTTRRVLLAVLLGCVSALTVAAAQKTAPPPAKGSTPRMTAEENYKTTCALCHGPDGNAPIKDMNFADGEWKHGSTLAAISTTITEGVKGTAMLPFKDKFSKQEILELAKLVRSFDKTIKKPVKK